MTTALFLPPQVLHLNGMLSTQYTPLQMCQLRLLTHLRELRLHAEPVANGRLLAINTRYLPPKLEVRPQAPIFFVVE